MDMNHSAAQMNTKKLPGSGEAQDLGNVSDSDIAAAEQIQKTQSIESVGTVITEMLLELKKFFQILLQKNNINLL